VPGKELTEKLRNLEAYGYDGIELGGSATLGERLGEVKQAFSASKVRASAICGGYPGDLLAIERDRRVQAMEGIAQRLRWASEIGAIGVIVVPTFGQPKVPNLSLLFEDERELEHRLLLEELRTVGKTAEDVGSKVLLEPLNRYETHFMNRLEQAAQVCDELGSDGVKIMADYFHMSIEEKDIVESLKRFSGLIYHVHLADSNRLTPGNGHTDFSSLKVLRDAGYGFYLSLECGVPADPALELPRTLRFLKSHLT